MARALKLSLPSIMISDDLITVVTLTRNRPQQLPRAIQTVSEQVNIKTIEHLILVDDCPQTEAMLRASTSLPNHVCWSYHARLSTESTGPARVAKLRNLGVELANGSRIAFLDDDNEWEPNHLNSLMACMAASECPAVHSHLTLHWPDGSPYLDPFFPWLRDRETASREYRRLVQKGVYQPESNIVRDRVDPLDDPDPVRTVDMGEWLFDKEVLKKIPFATSYDHADWMVVRTEDDKLIDDLVRNQVPICSTNLPTLRYFMGGYSNRPPSAPDGWLSP